MRIAIDTECTGTRFTRYTPDAPYYVSTCDENGKIVSWPFHVHPVSRIVHIEPLHRREITKTLSGYTDFVFHNAKFDLAALESVGIGLPPEAKIHDTILRFHLLDNTCSLKLKDLSILHLDIPADDEADLIDAIQQARRIAKKLGWNIAKADRPETEKGHWMKVDGWLPALIAANHPELLPDLGTTLAEHPWKNILAKYGDRDAERTMALELFAEVAFDAIEKATPKSTPNGCRITDRYQAQVDVIEPINTMETFGVSINTDRLQASLSYFKEKVRCHKAAMQDIVQDLEFNPNSGNQLRDILFEEFRLPIIKLTKTGQPSTDEETIQGLAACSNVQLNPESDQAAFMHQLLEYKASESSRSHLATYDTHRLNNRLHTSFNQTGTFTTRLSSSGPNLQNIEKEEAGEDDEGADDRFIRRVFGPEKGRIWLDFDYNQLQLRIFAYLSEDKRMISAFEAGWDAHNYMACQVFRTDNPTKLQRRVAKTINFGFIFGAGPDKVEAVSGDSTVWPTVQRLFPGAVSYISSTVDEVRRTGGVVHAMGYPLQVPKDPKTGKPKAYAGVVYKVQGMEGLIVKRAMVSLNKYLNLVSEKNSMQLRAGYPSPRGTLYLTESGNYLPFCFLTLQVHDQLIADFQNIPAKFLNFHAKSLKNLMEEAGTYHGIVTPADGDIIRDSWDQPEELKLA